MNQAANTPWWLPIYGANWLYPYGNTETVISLGILDHPVVHVSHNDASAYCRWRGARLPSEAEFERALRGDLDSNEYPWGNDFKTEGRFRANLWQGNFPFENLAEDGYPYSCPITAFGEQNKFGLYNIVGNVWEWTMDAWETTHSTKSSDGGILRDPIVQASLDNKDIRTVERVKKGGSFMCHKSYCYRYRTSSRSSNTADSSAQNLGFRCAKNIEPRS